MEYDVGEIIDFVIAESLPGFAFREGQRDLVIGIIDAFVNQGKTTVLLDAATGAGKSYIARIVAEVVNQMYSLDTLFITKTISLQNQYLRDFKDMAKLMGAKNYPCHTDIPLPIPNTKKVHPTCKYTRESGMCEYAKAKRDFQAAKLKNLNYAFFFTAGGKYNARGLLVADEAHTLPEFLMDHSKLVINYTRLSQLCNDVNIADNLPDAQIIKTKEFENSFLFGLIKHLELCISNLFQQISSINKAIAGYESSGDEKMLADLINNRLAPLEDKLGLASSTCEGIRDMLSNGIDDWVLTNDTGDRDLIFEYKPLDVPDQAIESLKDPMFRLLMTATPFNLIEDLKIPSDTVAVIKSGYKWPLDNRPFIVERGLPSMNYQTRIEVFPLYVSKLDDFVDSMGTETSGLVHSASYANAELLVEQSRHAKRMYIPTPQEVRNLPSIIKPGRIIVSPSILEGVDLKDDMCRFQIFLKISYPNLGDPWVARKKVRDTEWYDTTTYRDIIQGSGRAVRSEEDFAVTYMLDQSFDRLTSRIKNSIPEWFLNTII